MATRIKVVLAGAAWLAGSIFIGAVTPLPASAAGPGWLDRLNTWRVATNVSPLSENTTWDTGDYDHSLYMVKNDLVTHYETAGTPYYTVDGDTAARNGNIQVSSTTSTADTTAIDWWMAAPFHELGMMDPRLSSTGFGAYREVKSGWQAGFTLDTLRGNSFTGGTYPVEFPGNGSAVPLTSYGGGEFPDPLQGCPGYSAPTGLPVTIQVGGNVATSVTAHAFTGNGSPLNHCVIDSSNSAVGSNLTSRGAVILVPQQPLQAGVKYVVALTVNGVPYTWSFGITSDGSIQPPIPAGWSVVGGVGTTSPDAAAWSSTRSDVFVRGTDNALWHRSWNGTTWGAWESLGGYITADPSAVSWGANRLDVFVRGSEGALWHRSSDGTTWSNWEKLGGYLTSAPDAASWGPNRIDVFVTGTNNHGLWDSTWNGTSWSWSSLGGVATSDPGAVGSSPNHLDVFVRGTDQALWDDSWNGTAWAWTSLGGVATTGPDASSCTAGHVDVFTVGTDGGLWQRGFNGSAWGSWSNLHGYWDTTPSAVCPPGTTTVQLFELSLGGVVLTGTATGS